MFYRNQLVTLVKDVPWSILWRALPKVMMYLHYQYVVERRNGAPQVALGAYAEFLKMLPATLLKRRKVMRRRAISAPELRSMMRADYPFPTRWKRLAGARN